MSELSQPIQEQARHMLRTWLTVQNRSLRNLAQEAGIQPSIISRFLNGATTIEASSALKLYSVMQHDMKLLDRKAFIEAVGLLPLALALSRDAIFTIDMNAPRHDVGSRLMVTALDLYNHALHEQAIPVFRMVEEVLGAGSSQAAFAACMMAQMFINLGDYHSTETEVVRIENTYRLAMDLETRAELYRIRTWLDYYQGNYTQAEQWSLKRIKLGEEGGIERLKNPHFTGRIYYDLGCLCSGTKETAQLLHQAELCFDYSYQINQRWGDEPNRAFDLFRKAQVLQAQGEGTDAKQLRTQAREMFMDGSVLGSIAVLNIDGEEMRLLLEDGNVKLTKRKAEDVLSSWARLKYPKGIGDSLQVLGELAYVENDLERALEIFVTRLCIYPYDNYSSSCLVLEEVYNIQRELVQREGRQFYQEMLHRIEQLAKHRQGYFSYLDQIAVDRSADLDRVLSRLQISS